MQWKGTSVKALVGSSRAVAGVLLQVAGFLGVATIAVGTTSVEAQPRDIFYGFSRPYAPRSYYAPDYGSRFDDGAVDPLIRRTAEQLRRSPKPPPTKGPLLVAISLSKQHLVVYDDGVPIAESRISSGTESYPTPTGVFSIIQKQRWHRSNLYSDAPMPFMQRITWSGVALHAGKLPGYPASHGCIRLPDDFAVRLFRTTAVGARVVITQRETAPVEISHPRLFTLPAPDAVPMAQAKPLVQPVSSAAAAPVAPAAAAPVTATPDAGDTPAQAEAKTETKVASAAPEPGSATDAPPVEKTLRAGPVSVFVSRK
jgi:lipoprotein-anchoring transpeptidase ErfK/SrfK